MSSKRRNSKKALKEKRRASRYNNQLKKEVSDMQENVNEVKEDVEAENLDYPYKTLDEAIAQIIRARKEQNMTQAELAKRVGTQKSNISRLESGNYNPSLNFLVKVAESLGKKLSVQLN